MTRIALSVTILLSCSSVEATAAGFRMCIDPEPQAAFLDTFRNGPVIVPPGTVFDLSAVVDHRNTAGVITLFGGRLTRTSPCLTVQAAAVMSEGWGWVIAPIFGNDRVRYQAYGVVRNGLLDIHFDEGRSSFEFAAASGGLSGTVTETLTRTIRLRDDNAQ